MFEGLTPTKFGRVQSVAPMQLHRLHVSAPSATLREVSWTVPIPVLDQEDLFAQGIDTSQLVPGAQKVDALGSCTCNAGTGHLAERMAAVGHELAGLGIASSTGAGGATLDLRHPDAKTAEEFAILLYHLVTDQTGNPASEWPPTDCGSSGYYVCTELEKQGFASTYKTGAGVLGALSLLQAGTVMQGSPWFNAWFKPDSQGFVDCDGSVDAFMAALESGVAGGHETLQTGIPQFAVTSSGQVDLQNTVIEVRNSWSVNFGLAGSYRIHASTLDLLSAYTDYKAIVI
jgi:hypothetical protein